MRALGALKPRLVNLKMRLLDATAPFLAGVARGCGTLFVLLTLGEAVWLGLVWYAAPLSVFMRSSGGRSVGGPAADFENESTKGAV